MLDAQPAIVVEIPAGATDNPPDGIESVRAAAEGEPRFVTDIGMQEKRIIIPHIWRVADEEGKGPMEHAEPVAQYKIDLIHPVLSGIDPGYSERFFTDVRGSDVAGGTFFGKGQRDRATTCPQIGNV